MKRAVIFTFIAVALLYAVRWFEYEGLHRCSKGEFGKLNETFLEKHDCDILFIGSSRAECQFYPPVIDSATGMKSFNIGMEGATLPFIRTSLEAYLVHSDAPAYVVLNIDIHSLSDNPDTVYLFPRYFAYLDNKKLYGGLKSYDPRFAYFRYLPFYSMPYFNQRYVNASLHGWTNSPFIYDENYISGFSPCIPDTKEGDLDTMKMPAYDPQPKQFVWDELHRICDICASNHCKLIFVCSPVFHRLYENIPQYNDLKEMFEKEAGGRALPFIDLTQSPVSRHKEFYADPAHLNKAGAIAFSREFSAVLKQYVSQ